MPFPSPTFLNQIRGVLGFVAGEFEHFYAQLEGYLRKEHKDDGSHGDVTAQSVVVANDVTAGGDLTAWAGHPSRECALGILPNDDPVLGASGDVVGLKIGSREPIDGKPWFLLTQRSFFAGPPQGNRRELIFVDGNQSDSLREVAAALYYVPDGGFGRYVFGPSSISNRHPGSLDLGSPDNTRRINDVYARRLDALLGVTERGRSVPMGEWQGYTPSWISSGGTQPNLGTGGNAFGRYTLIGNTMHVRARITLGTGFSFGTGTHGLTLPLINFGQLLPVATPAQMLTARYVDVGTGIYVQVAYVTPILGLAVMPFITGTGPIAAVSSTSPFTFAAGDILEIGGTVELAEAPV